MKARPAQCDADAAAFLEGRHLGLVGQRAGRKLQPGHLAGKGGVQALLETKGYKVIRIQ